MPCDIYVYIKFIIKIFMNHNIIRFTGVIHGDFNEQNILVTKSEDTQACASSSSGNEGDYHVSGVIDFGDSSYGPYIFEAAITITYMMLVERLFS